MKLYEYKAKEVFAKYNIPVPKSIVVLEADEFKGEELDFPVVIKSQVLVGGRGKAGGIKFADDLNEARERIDVMLNSTIKGCKVKKVLVEEKLDIEKEIYIGITLDRSASAPLLLASAEGGVEIETVPEEKLFKKHITPFLGIQPFILRNLSAKLRLSKEEGKKISKIVSALYALFDREDAELVEINPLVITSQGEVIAADAKLIIDNDALFRHPEYEGLDEDLTPLEKRAKQKGIAFIQLDGDIGVIANGAGLTMATLDNLSFHGGKGGVFLDLGGTDDPEKVKEAILLMKDAEPSVILLNIFGGITKCDTVAIGVKDAIEIGKIDIPVVARIKGLNEEKAKKILRNAGIVAVDTIEQAAKEAITLGGR